MNLRIMLLAVLTLATTGTARLQAQDKDATAVQAMVDTKNFVFKAQRALPLGARDVTLTTGYDLTVRPDSLISYLPYYGRAYVAPVDPTKGGIQFTSTNFNYKATKRKKDKWEVVIKPTDYSDVQDMTLDIFDNGTATLHVNNQNRQSISFQGYVVEGRALNKKGF